MQDISNGVHFIGQFENSLNMKEIQVQVRRISSKLKGADNYS